MGAAIFRDVKNVPMSTFGICFIFLGVGLMAFANSEHFKKRCGIAVEVPIVVTNDDGSETPSPPKPKCRSPAAGILSAVLAGIFAGGFILPIFCISIKSDVVSCRF